MMLQLSATAAHHGHPPVPGKPKPPLRSAGALSFAVVFFLDANVHLETQMRIAYQVRSGMGRDL